MNAREFLEVLLPDSGSIYVSTAAAGGDDWKERPFGSLDAAIAHADWAIAAVRNVYFALSTFPEGTRGRTKENATQIKSFFLDLDVDPANPSRFVSQREALDALKVFQTKVGLPTDGMLVSSGGGIHVYWPLAHSVSTATWFPVAERLKAICKHDGFRADPNVTSDMARVLRLVGSTNHKRGKPCEVIAEAARMFSFAEIEQAINEYAATVDLPAVPVPRTVTATPAFAGTQPVNTLPSNLESEDARNINGDLVAFSCRQLGLLVGDRGTSAHEPLWFAALGIAKQCLPEQQALAVAAVSDGHRDYSAAAATAKMHRWNAGATTCAKFDNENPGVCPTCPHFGTLTSPAQLGHATPEVEAALTVVTQDAAGVEVRRQLVPPPFPYEFNKSGAVVRMSEDAEGNAVQVGICAYKLYPLDILRQPGADAVVNEHSVWQAHLPERGQERIALMTVPQSLIADGQQLTKFLASQGLMLYGDQPKATQQYMSAYLQELAAKAGRENLFSRLGWHSDHTAFVLGTTVMYADGSERAHVPSPAIKSTTRGGVTAVGSLDKWRSALEFYNRPGLGYAGHRMFLYAAFGSPIFHMNDVGNNGVILAATGESGRGKTTCLKACASIWGNPATLLVNGNKSGTTTNALYDVIGTYHSLPVLLDDTTDRDDDDMKQILLSISQGWGKRRMLDGQRQAESTATWALITLMTTNTDDVNRLMALGAHTSPHMMRLMKVDFATVDNGTESKILADEFIRTISENYGHAGPLFAKYLVANYDAVRTRYINAVAEVDRLLNSPNASAERFWSGCVAAALVGARIAAELHLIPAFDLEADLKWMIQCVVAMRTTINTSKSTPIDLFNEFTEYSIDSTLALLANSADIDGIETHPHRSLFIRHEMDPKIMYVSINACRAFLEKRGANINAVEQALIDIGAMQQRSVMKVLGSNTKYAKGQTRCWKIDMARMPKDAEVSPLSEKQVTRQSHLKIVKEGP